MMIYETIEKYFDIFVRYCVLLTEMIGVFVLLWAVIHGFIGFFRRSHGFRLELAEGIALALDFKMGSELLRTVVVREIHELFILGAVILLRAALSFLIYWKIGNEKKNEANN